MLNIAGESDGRASDAMVEGGHGGTLDHEKSPSAPNEIAQGHSLTNILDKSFTGSTLNSLTELGGIFFFYYFYFVCDRPGTCLS